MHSEFFLQKYNFAGELFNSSPSPLHRPPSTPSVLQGCPHVPSPLLVSDLQRNVNFIGALTRLHSLAFVLHTGSSGAGNKAKYLSL